MHRYRIVAQISLILSILNLVLAAPIVVQETHEAHGDDAVAEDVPAMPNKVRRVGGSIGQTDVSVAFVFVGRVDVFGLSYPASVVGFVGFRLFVVVGQAAAPESEPSAVAARTGISSPFTGKFRVLGLTTSSMVLACVGTAEATISFRVAGMFASSPFKLRVIDVYTIFVGVRRVAVFALFFGIGRVRLGAFA
jgi:hypothetical protein